MPQATPFLGRQRELAVLCGYLTAAFDGHGGVVLVGGEPGIGKTRLMEEFTRTAAGSGARTLWGRCQDGQAAPAYWPWVQVVRAYAATRDPAELAVEFGAGVADLAQIDPVLSTQLGRPPVPPVLEPAAARFRLFGGVANLLCTAASTRPVLVVLDDLHEADHASLALLRFLTREIANSRLLVVGTHRSAEATSPGTATGPPALPEGHRLVLAGLRNQDVAALLAAEASIDPDADLVAAVHAATGGNPFFVTEVVHLLATVDDAGPQHGAALPDGVRAVVSQRLDRLPESCRRALDAAAVLGSEFTLHTLAAMLRADPEKLLTLLEEAAASRIVTRASAALDRWSFAHPLIREVLYAQLSATGRVNLHRAAARTLAATHAADPQPHLAELAHHYLAAATLGDTDEAVTMACRAGRQALVVHAFQEAADLFERALQVVDGRGAPDPIRRCEVLLALGEARLAAGDTSAGRAVYRQAGDLAGRVGAAEPLAMAALGLGTVVTVGLVDPDEIRLLDQARAALHAAAPDSPLYTRVLARLARVLLWTPQLQRRVALSDEATTLARRLDDPDTLAAVLYDRHLATWGSDRDLADERLALATEVIRLAEHTGDRVMALRGRQLRLTDLFEIGDMAAYDTELTAAETTADVLGQIHYRWHLLLARAVQHAMAGRFTEAENLTEQAYTMGTRSQDPGVVLFHAQATTIVRLLQGRLDEIADRYADIDRRYPAMPVIGCALAAALAIAGRPEAARAHLTKTTTADLDTLPRDMLWTPSLAFLAIATHRLREAALAPAIYARLLPHARHNIATTRFGAACYGPAAHYLGLLTLVMDRPADAVRHLQYAVDLETRMGAVAMRVHSRHHLGLALRARGLPGDAEQARAHLDRAAKAAHELGIAPTSPPDPPGRLSGREVEVLRLIAAGKSNRDIATALFISPNTVLRHVSNIFTKIGAANRAEAAAFAATHQLLDDLHPAAPTWPRHRRGQ